MKKILFIVMIMTALASSAFAQTKEVDKELKVEAEKIGKELSLDSKTEHLVYNVLYHVKTRIADIPLRHENYAKLIGYIDDERVSMMKALLPNNKYKQYDAAFGKLEKQKINDLISKNNEEVKKHGVLVIRVSGVDMTDKLNQDTESSEEDGDDNEEIIETEESTKEDPKK